MMKTKHRLLAIFFILLFAACIFCIFGAASASAATTSGVYDISNGTLIIDESNVSTYNGFTITGSGNSYDNRVVIDGVSVELTIDGLNISEASSKASTRSAIELTNGATLILNIEGTNNLQGTYGGAGIEVPGGCRLEVIQGCLGTLNAKGSNRYGGGAGIGAKAYFNIYNQDIEPIREQTVGEIVIRGGFINATGGTTLYTSTTTPICGGAGIGGTVSGKTGKIIIEGGIVNAFAGYGSAGIGGSLYGNVESIEITSTSVVQAYMYKDAPDCAGAAIGSGNAINEVVSCGDIKLTQGLIGVNGNIGYGGTPQNGGSYSGGSVTITDDVDIIVLNGVINPAGNARLYSFDIDVYDSRLTDTTTASFIFYRGWSANHYRQITLDVDNYHGSGKVDAYLPDDFIDTEISARVIISGDVTIDHSIKTPLKENTQITVGEELGELELILQSSDIVEDIELPADAITVTRANGSLTSTNHVIDSRIVSVDKGRGVIKMFLPAGDTYDVSLTTPTLNGGEEMKLSDISIAPGKNSHFLLNDSDQDVKEFNINNGNITFGYAEGGLGYFVEYYNEDGTSALISGLSADEEFTVYGTGSTTNTVTVNGWGKTPLNLTIRSIEINNINAIDINDSYVGLKLVDSNIVSGDSSEGEGYALISVDQASQLTISGEGSLTVKLAEYSVGAGIGGDENCTAGTVIFESGTYDITVGNNARGAGIGSAGNDGSDATVIINGGTFNVASAGRGAGIGTGDAPSSETPKSTVTINGGIFYLCQTGTYSNQGTCIGVGNYGYASVTINGGSFFSTKVYATSLYGYIGRTTNSEAELDLKINGGSIYSNIYNVTDYTNNAGSALTKTAIKLDRAYTLVDVNNSAISGLDYGFCDVMTNGVSTVYLYLPDSVTEMTIDSLKFTGSVSEGFTRQLSIRANTPTDSELTHDSASILVQSTDDVTLYWMSSSTQPTVEQLKNQSSQQVNNDSVTISLTGLSPNTSYTYWFVAEKDGVLTDIKKVTFRTLKLTTTKDLLDYTLPTDLEYNGNPHSVSVTSNASGLGTIAVLYRLVGEENYTVLPPINAGSYEVIAEIQEGDSYYAATLELGVLVIAKNDLDDIKLEGYVGEYDFEEHDAVTVTGNLKDLRIEYSADCGISWSIEAIKVKDLTTQIITVRLSGSNYIERIITVDVQVISAFLKPEMVEEIEKVYYDGNAKQPQIKLAVNGRALAQGEDYILSYSNNVNAGRGVATLNGIGHFQGQLEVQFDILPKSLTELTFEGLREAYSVTGSEIRPEFSVKDGDVLLTADLDYTVEYSNNLECGIATIAVLLTGNYSGRVEQSFRVDHVFNENGFCCDTYQLAEPNESGYYEISNAGQLFWFADYVNTVDRAANAVLVADIDLEERLWTPIGSTGEDSNNFRGIFDGQNHTIKGLYVVGGRAGLGFFGEVRTGTVKNFTIYGEVLVNTEVDYVGGVIGSICGLNSTDHGLSRNGAVIQNITSYVNLTAGAHGVGKIGGFVGYANHESLIENCSWYGTFDAGIYRVDNGAGGFIGRIQENTSEVTIRNCAAYGTIKTGYVKGSYIANGVDSDTIYMGGFLSFSNTNAKTTLENCLFAGRFERGENLTDMAELAAFGTLNGIKSIQNCYYLGDDGLEAVHSKSPLNPNSEKIDITSVTKAQLLSGEVAYKLGEAWGQTLEGENRQSYPVLGGTKVEESQRFEIYGQQLNIGGDLSMKYYVMGYAPEFNSEGLAMEFCLGGVKTKVYAGEPNADGFYVFTLEGINPQCMGDNIYARLLYNEAAVANHGYDKKYSVEVNLNNLIAKYPDDAALVALINDTLAYGKASEAYRGYTSTEGDYTGSDREIPASEMQLSDVIAGYTVRFGVLTSIIIEVNPSAFDNNLCVVECNGTEIRNFPSPNSPLYQITNIAAMDFEKEWVFVIRSTKPMEEPYGTFVISINDYLYSIIQSADASDTMKALAKALYNLGVSAKEYAASQDN